MRWEIQYADDTILFLAEGERKFVCHHVDVGAARESGLKVNFSQNKVVGINMDDMTLGRATFIMGCQIGVFPFSYLGLPLTPEVLPLQSLTQCGAKV